MTVYPNPFHSRASEHHRDQHQFVSTFGAGAVSMLPETLWDRLVILRSSPGAGKTSLMRLFTVDSLLWVRARARSYEPLYNQLVEVGALDDDGPRKLGVLINLDRDYRALLDLPLDEAVSRRVFLRLLDTRVILGVVRAALTLAGRRYPDDVGAFRLGLRSPEPALEAASDWLGGPDGAGILEAARGTERRVLGLLNALLPSDLDRQAEAQGEIVSLRLLAEATLLVDGAPLDVQPVLMFDDGHALEHGQRDLLLDQLRRRHPTLGRWYAERFEALSDQELMEGIGSTGRDHIAVNLDEVARGQAQTSRVRFRRGRHDPILADIATRRATPVLRTYAYAREEHDFFTLLEAPEEGDYVGPEAVERVRQRVLSTCEDDERYRRWIDDAAELEGRAAAVRWREIEVLVARDRRREQELFPGELTEEDRGSRSSSAVREGAELSVARDLGIPFYAGRRRLLALGSHNTEQFLNLCGALFDEMLVAVSLGSSPYLSSSRQDRVLRQASEEYWESIPRIVDHGRDVRAIVHHIVRIAVAEARKPTMPYPPGVTGTALLMAERDLLLDPEFRRKTPGADRFFAALAAAVANNVLAADLDYSVKNNRYMVLHLNRLLCPRFDLPLGRGSFRERPLSTMLRWVRNLPPTGEQAEIGEQVRML